MPAGPQQSAIEVPHRNRWQRGLSAVVLIAAIGALALKRDMVSQVADEFATMRLESAILLLGLVFGQRCVNALTHRNATPTVRFREMMLATEAYSGASHSFAGGAGIGTALRVAMFRSWGVSGTSIAVAIAVMSIFPSFAMWSIAGAHTLPRLIGGTADRNETLVAIGSVLFIAGPMAFWTFMLKHSGSIRVMQVVADRLLRVAHRLRSKRFRGFVSKHISQLTTEFVDLRVTARSLLRSNGLPLITGAVGAQLMLMLILLASASAVAPEVSLPVLELARAFALLRVMSSFVPVPGGIGIVDVGLVEVMEGAGMTSTEAVAAIALYRSVTFLLPLLTGPVCAFVWWRKDGRHQVLRPDLSVAEPLRAAA